MTRILLVVFGGLLLLASIPLVLGKVPMNNSYGIRIPRAMKSEENWYAVNAVGGRRVMLLSLVIIALGIAGWFVPGRYRQIYDVLGPFVAFGLVLVVFISVGIWSRRNLL
jgi:hypothetical protein